MILSLVLFIATIGSFLIALLVGVTGITSINQTMIGIGYQITRITNILSYAFVVSLIYNMLLYIMNL